MVLTIDLPNFGLLPTYNFRDAGEIVEMTYFQIKSSEK